MDREFMKFDIITQWVLAYRENPTRPKSSQQVGSEVHGQTWQQESGAGRIKAAGCVIEPRNRAHGGHRISSGNRTKVDVVYITEGSSFGYAMASNQNTTGVLEQGMQT